MGKIIEYKGYNCSWNYDKDYFIYYGRIEEIEDSISYHSAIDNPYETIKEAVDDYIEILTKLNELKTK